MEDQNNQASSIEAKSSPTETKPALTFDRQMDLFNPYEHQVPIVLVGAGTIGSWTALALSKIGFDDIYVFDPDIVEPQNRSNQLYGSDSLGDYKVEELKWIIQMLSNNIITQVPETFPNEYPKNCIIIVTVDSMKSRKEIFKWLQVNFGDVQFFIDARTGGEVARVFAFSPSMPSEMDRYALTLHDDKPAEGMNEEAAHASDIPCTARSIVDVSLMVASRITNTVRKLLTKKDFPFETDIDMRNDIWISQR